MCQGDVSVDTFWRGQGGVSWVCHGDVSGDTLLAVCQRIRPRDTRRAAEAGPWRKAAGGSRIRDTHMEEIYVYIGS